MIATAFAVAGVAVAGLLLVARGYASRAWLAALAGGVQATVLAALASGVIPGMSADPLGRIAALGLAVAWFAASLSAPSYYRSLLREGAIAEAAVTRVLVLTSLFTAALAVVTTSTDLALSWVMLEATTITGAFLVGFDGTARRLEAAWKFAILCFGGVGFGLVGIGLLASTEGAGSTATSFTSLSRLAPTADPTLVGLAFAALIAAFGTKAGFVPLHWWLPDAHSQAPAPVSALMSGGLVASALVVLAQTRVALAPALGSGALSIVFAVAGLLGLALSVLSMVGQPDLKRLLAYSTIEHVALMTIALAIGTPLAAAAFAIHLVGHAALKAVAFLSAGALVESGGSMRIEEIGGSLERDRPNAVMLLVSSAGLLGAPPGPLFVSEALLIVAAMQARMTWLALIVTILLIVGFAAFAERVLTALLGKSQRQGSHGPSWSYILPSAVVLLGTAALVVSRPEWALALVREAAVALSGGAPW